MRNDVAALAEQQDGAVSRADLVGLGLTRGQIDGLIRGGAIKRVAPSVFVICGSPSTHRRQLQVGLLALGPRSWVSFEAAAGLHDLDRSPKDAVEFTVLRRERKRTLDITVHSSRWMPSRDQVVYRRGSRTVARVDFLFEDQGVVIEVDGRRGHSSDAERAKDGQRRGELIDLGLRVYEHTWHEVVHQPFLVANLVRRRLAGTFVG